MPTASSSRWAHAPPLRIPSTCPARERAIRRCRCSASLSLPAAWLRLRLASGAYGCRAAADALVCADSLREERRDARGRLLANAQQAVSKARVDDQLGVAQLPNLGAEQVDLRERITIPGEQ